MTTAVYAGSFDPVTNGHLDLIIRSAQTFDRVVVGVGVNSRKTPLFTTGERIELIEEALRRRADSCVISRIIVKSFEGLLVDFCHLHQASVIVRGLRAVSDFEAEMAMADANHEMARGIGTVFFPTRKEFTFISSSTVKEIAKHPSATGWLSLANYVPTNVLQALKGKLQP